MSILITVPHAVCKSYPRIRHCDRAAERAALILQELLEDTELILGDVLRSTLDLNREISINSKFQQRIRSKIKSLNPFFLFDVHSFPPDSDSFEETELTILDEQPGTEYGKSLRDYLRSKFVDEYTIGYYHGGGNFIMKQAREMGIPSLLLEYKESLTDNEIEELSIGVVEWLEEYFH